MNVLYVLNVIRLKEELKKLKNTTKKQKQKNLYKIKAEDLCKKSKEEVLSILKHEGDNSTIDIQERQFKEWWDIFELSAFCDRYGLSEAENGMF